MNTKEKEKNSCTLLFSFDAETNGLLGQAFALGAVLYVNEVEVKSFCARCPIQGTVDPWVEANVLPQMTDIAETHSTYKEMLQAFAEFFLENKADATIIFHMGIPVEARVILDMHDHGFIGPWDGAYPWLDVAGCLDQAGYDPTSVDTYNKNAGITVPQREPGGAHNPLYDSRAAALCYMDLMKQR